MIWILGSLIACGSKEDTASEPASEPSAEVAAEPSGEPASEDTSVDADCDTLDVDQCGERSDCAVISGREILVDETAECFTVSETTTPFGCMSTDIDCTEAIEFAQDPAVGECTWFSNGCLPINWESCQMEIEECQ